MELVPEGDREKLFEQLTAYAVEYPQTEEDDEDGTDLITAEQIDEEGNLMADRMDAEDEEDEEEEERKECD